MSSKKSKASKLSASKLKLPPAKELQKQLDDLNKLFEVLNQEKEHLKAKLKAICQKIVEYTNKK